MEAVLIALIGGIPATIAAWASFKGNKVGRAARDEIASPNGTSTGDTVHLIHEMLTEHIEDQTRHRGARRVGDKKGG